MHDFPLEQTKTLDFGPLNIVQRSSSGDDAVGNVLENPVTGQISDRNMPVVKDQLSVTWHEDTPVLTDHLPVVATHLQPSTR
jgi:hypothetical protein